MWLTDFFNQQSTDFFDPRILYDAQANRWVFCVVNKTTDQLHLAVSTGSSPTPLATSWNKYVIQVKTNNWVSDFPTLGMDANGIYISVLHYSNPGLVVQGHTVVAMRKSEIYNSIQNFHPFFQSLSDINTPAIMPALNFDSSPQGGFAWFIAKGQPQGQGGTYQGGPIRYRRMEWIASGSSFTPQWKDANWLTVSSSSYRDYFDFATQAYAPPQRQPNGQPGTVAFFLNQYQTIPQMAVIRNNNLWTCQAVGLDETNGSYNGGTVDRSAIQWLRMQTFLSGETLRYHSHGRIYDDRTTYPYWYYMPSLTVNMHDHVLAGFSGSRGTEYIGAFYSGRGSQGTFSKPVLIQAGIAYYPLSLDRWGDYSFTSLDPDGNTFWTVQEYASKGIIDSWSTWIISVKDNQ